MADPGRVFAKVRRSRSALAGALLVAVYLGAAALAGLAPRGPKETDQKRQLKPPGAGQWLGTDNLGRDILSRVLHGARWSLGIGIAAVAFALFVGVPLGLLAGEAGGWIDLLIMRAVDVLLAFPAILLAIAIVATLGSSLPNLMLAVGIVNIPTYARQVRASVLQVRELDYVLAARALGASRFRVVMRQILPNVLSPIVVLATLGVGTAILEAAGLGFVGLGVEVDTPEWGRMLALSRGDLMQYPWTVVAPGIAISIAILGFNLLGDALRDALDPRVAKI